jgi:F0F1-type ATP synthase alpha subunit
LTNVKSTLSPEAEARLRNGEAMTHILTQDKNRPVSLEEQIVLLYALKSPALDRLDARGWKRLKAGIFPFLLKTRAALIREIGADQRLSPRIKEQLEEGLAECLRSQRPDEESS